MSFWRKIIGTLTLVTHIGIRHYYCPYCNADLTLITNPKLIFSSRNCPSCGKKIYWNIESISGWGKRNPMEWLLILIICMIFVIVVLVFLVFIGIFK